MSDYYSILGVNTDSTKDEIKKAYNNLVKIYYPDKPTGNAALFEKITNAYKTLISESERSLYDDMLKEKDYINLKKTFKKDIKILKTKDLGSLPTPFQDKPILEKDMYELVSDREFVSQLDDIETTQPNLFPETFNRSAFNSLFEKYYPSNDTLIPYDQVLSGYDSMFDNYNLDNVNDDEKESYSDNFLSDITDKLDGFSISDFESINESKYTDETPLTSEILVNRMREYNSFIV